MEGLVGRERCMDPGGLGGEQLCSVWKSLCNQISHPEP